MHLARLWDSSRRTDGGYSLEALTSDPKVIGSANKSHSRVLSGNESWLVDQLVAGKISMKSIFGKKKVKKMVSKENLSQLLLWKCFKEEKNVYHGFAMPPLIQ